MQLLGAGTIVERPSIVQATTKSGAVTNMSGASVLALNIERTAPIGRPPANEWQWLLFAD